jgi:hypothetical protein
MDDGLARYRFGQYERMTIGGHRATCARHNSKVIPIWLDRPMTVPEQDSVSA